MNSNPVFIQRERNFSQAEIHLVATQEITWTVPNLYSLPKDDNFSLDSPSFDFQNATWCLRLYPSGAIRRVTDSIWFTIVRLDTRVLRHKLQYLLISRDNEKVGCYGVADFGEDCDESKEIQFISVSEDSDDDDSGVPRGSVEMICRVSCYGSQAADALSQTELSLQDAKDIGALCQNFKNMLLNGQNHDIVLKVKDKEFRAHQDILRARSPVFEFILSDDMVEQNRGVIHIPNCDDPCAFQQFLFYLYSGEVEMLDTHNMLSVYSIADKYNMGHLKEVCRKFIKESMTCAILSHVLEFALNHRDAVLMACATQFFVKEMPSVVRTVEWQSFMQRNPILANKLIIRAADKLYARKI